MLSAKILQGDCLTVMRTMPADSVDAVVTDPPAGIEFMGKEWDNPIRAYKSVFKEDGMGKRLVAPSAPSRNPRCVNCGGEKRRRIKAPEKQCRCEKPNFREVDDRCQRRTAFINWLACIMAEALRVLKPGGYAFVWALPRTSHWTATALEDAGFEIRDIVHHAVGGEELLDSFLGSLSQEQHTAFARVLETLTPSKVRHIFGSGFPKSKALLKPAVEEWILCRKPGPLRHLRIDACRVGLAGHEINARTAPAHRGNDEGVVYGDFAEGQDRCWSATQGRWPSNFCLSHCGPVYDEAGTFLSPGCEEVGTKRVRNPSGSVSGKEPSAPALNVYGDMARVSWQAHGDSDGTEEVAEWRCVEGCPVALLDGQSGVRTSGKPSGRRQAKSVFSANAHETDLTGYGDTGTASRFFHCFPPDPFIYQPKASRRERNAGCEGLPEKRRQIREDGRFHSGGRTQIDGEWKETGSQPLATRNDHPTVKPIALMRHLIRLIAAPGDLVLDPFAGSGSTLVAALREGCQAIGIEQDAEYVEIARSRLAHAQPAQMELAS